MGLSDKLQNVEKKYALTFLGFVLAAIFGGITIYTEFIQEKNPHLRYIVGSSSVFSVRDDMAKLDVLLNGINIRERKQTLSLVTLEVVNTGGSPILKGSYDEQEPLGLELKNGNVVKAEVVKATSDYLTRNVRALAITTNRIIFPRVIIEPNDLFSVRVLVLHDEGTTVDLLPLGKVAGVQRIEVIQASQVPAEPPFWKRVFAGNIFVHLTRAFGYLAAMILLVLSIVLPTAFLSDWASTRKREKAVRDFREITELKLNADDDFIFQSFLGRGSFYLHDVAALLNAPKVLQKYLKEDLGSDVDWGTHIEHAVELERIRHIEQQIARGSPTARSTRFSTISSYERQMSHALLAAKFISVDGENVNVNEHMFQSLNAFTRFLKARGLMEQPHTTFTEHVTSGGGMSVP